MSYSQGGQDKFILSLFDKNYEGTFVDVGCQLPNEINNTLLLEKNGWTGISIDIEDYSQEWKTRKNVFICCDALLCNYKNLFSQYFMPKVIDYLSLDIEGDGLRYQALKKVIESNHEFKVITIEHDLYRGYDISERQPQRKLLREMGYFLLCSDVYIDNKNFPFEDWWVNPKYFEESQYIHYKADNQSCWQILKNANL